MGMDDGGEILGAVRDCSKGLEVWENILHLKTVGWSPVRLEEGAGARLELQTGKASQPAHYAAEGKIQKPCGSSLKINYIHTHTYTHVYTHLYESVMCVEGTL